MTARLIRPFHVRLDVRTGKAEMARPRTTSNTGGSAPHGLSDQQKGSDAGSIKVVRDDRPSAEERREPSFSPAPKNSGYGPIKVRRDDRPVVEARREPSLSAPPKSADNGAIKVRRDDDPAVEERREPSLSPSPRDSGNASIKVQRDDVTIAEERREPSLSAAPTSSEDGPAEITRDDKIVIEDLEREHEFRAALASSVKAGNRLARQHDRLETGTIIRIAAAVIVVGLGFTALLPSILTRDPVAPAVSLTTPAAPAAPAQAKQLGAAQPAAEPRPELPPAVAPPVPAPASKDATSVAKAPPVLRGSNTPDVQGNGRAAAQAAMPNSGKAAVTRGLQELEKQAAVATPPRPRAAARPQLTDEEKAAVERGLRELEKAAGQAKP
jgi:hypothetical protein